MPITRCNGDIIVFKRNGAGMTSLSGAIAIAVVISLFLGQVNQKYFIPRHHIKSKGSLPKCEMEHFHLLLSKN